MFTQKNKSKNTPDQRLVDSFEAGKSAILASLGKGGTYDEVYDTIALLAGFAVTGNGNLTMAESTHNLEIFVEMLKATVIEIGSPTADKSTQTSRLM